MSDKNTMDKKPTEESPTVEAHQTVPLPLQALFRLTVAICAFVVAFQFVTLAFKYSNSEISVLPSWMSKENIFGLVLMFIIIYVVVKIIGLITSAFNGHMIRRLAKKSKLTIEEREKFVKTDQFHAPYYFSAILFAISAGVSFLAFKALEPYAGWTAEVELTTFFITGPEAGLNYVVTVFGIYYMISNSWRIPKSHALFCKPLKDEEYFLINTETGDVTKKVDRKSTVFRAELSDDDKASIPRKD